MLKNNEFVFWFVTGSQHLYGQETLKKVEEHSRVITAHFAGDQRMPYKVLFKPVLTTPDAIRRLCLEANADDACAGIITWMHTFSPAKMWIEGLLNLNKPLLHLHTQFNRNIPWDKIDMDFMNLNQSAHGDREYGHIGARLEIKRKVIAGYWEDDTVVKRIGNWMRIAVSVNEGRSLKVARFGDNMREVAVTEGDKVEAQIKFGWSVSGYGIGEIAACINDVSESQISSLLDEYEALYDMPEGGKNGAGRESIKEQAKIELGMKAFLEAGNFTAFTTTFEDLHGLKQLPGLAVQRLMEAGYGFGAEGDWKTSALVRIMKIIADNKGTSFMEDYTYHFEPGNEMILGAHMLEICPTIAANKPKIEVHPLSIGGKADPARLVFEGRPGPAVCASLIDLGNRFRLILSVVDAVKAEKPMPNLPVASILWKPRPSLIQAAESWILAGGAHHTSFSLNIDAETLSDWADMSGIECVIIDENTTPAILKKELRLNNFAWKL